MGAVPLTAENLRECTAMGASVSITPGGIHEIFLAREDVEQVGLSLSSLPRAWRPHSPSVPVPRRRSL
jgi:hypothetical protein